MRDQGYDGASNMSSQNVGVQAIIRKDTPLETYVHCSGHCLNLVISHSCMLVEVQNVLDRLKHCCRFFQLSPKRDSLLQLIIDKNVIHEERRKTLLNTCRTRWAECHSAYQHFCQSYTYSTSFGSHRI